MSVVKQVALVFPWCGSFRFHNNKFCFPPSEYDTHWLLAFQGNSHVCFVGNDFAGSNIQTRCLNSAVGQDDSDDIHMAEQWGGSIAFVANRGVHGLWIQKGYSSIEITGMNQINRLNVDLIVDSDRAKQTLIYLGPREKIDLWFHNCLEHRSLFLAMKQIAAMNHDHRQLTILDKQLERIEYFLNKEQDTPSVLEYGVWIEYWQDRALYVWRRWSSNFYRSWVRRSPCWLWVTC